jgi:hypothetical protein
MGHLGVYPDSLDSALVLSSTSVLRKVDSTDCAGDILELVDQSRAKPIGDCIGNSFTAFRYRILQAPQSRGINVNALIDFVAFRETKPSRVALAKANSWPIAVRLSN